MTIRFDPFCNFNKINKFFEEFPSGYNEEYLLKTDYSEGENNFYLDVEIPGVKKEDVKIKLENNILIVSGEKKIPVNENQKKNYLRKERNYGTFKRSFMFQSAVNPDECTANFENGVLFISIGKLTKKNNKERVININ